MSDVLDVNENGVEVNEDVEIFAYHMQNAQTIVVNGRQFRHEGTVSSDGKIEVISNDDLEEEVLINPENLYAYDSSTGVAVLEDEEDGSRTAIQLLEVDTD